MGRKTLGPVCCVMHTKELSALNVMRRGSPRCSCLIGSTLRHSTLLTIGAVKKYVSYFKNSSSTYLAVQNTECFDRPVGVLCDKVLEKNLLLLSLLYVADVVCFKCSSLIDNLYFFVT